jgi:DNA polymerase-1
VLECKLPGCYTRAMKKLYLVDVSSFFFRAFYAIPHLTNPEGMPTNALYGVLSMTIKLLREEKPDYMAFCYDTKHGSFRNELYSEYKANRSDMPEDLVPQVPYLKQLASVLGIPAFEDKGFEADDLIGSLSHLGAEQGAEVVIVSGDKDFAQLISPKVTMYDTMKNVRYDVDGVEKKWGVRPDQFIDYLALVGDSSDNIPGVKGIGPKGAQKLLGQYKTLEGIYENVEEISAKGTKQKLIDGENEAYLSKELVTIATDVQVVKGLDELSLRDMDQTETQELLEKLGFKSFLRTLLGKEGASDKSQNLNDSVVAKQGTSGEAKKKVTRKKTSSKKGSSSGFIEVEKIKESTKGPEELAEVVEPYSEVWAFPWSDSVCLGLGEHLYKIAANDLEAAAEVLNGKLVKWKGFDVKEVCKVLKLKDQQCLWDSMLACYVSRPSAVPEVGKVYEKFTGKTPIEELSAAARYSMERELEEIFLSEMENVEGAEVYKRFELPLVPVLTNMELNGITLNKVELARQSKDLEALLSDLTTKIHKHAGSEFNIGSPKQLSKVLFEDLGLAPGKKTKTGFSTNNDVLEKLKSDHEIIEHIMEYREFSKLKSTYVDALPELVDDSTGRLHTHFRQAVTTTGRLSSQNPNLQNIPIRTERGRKVRKAFEAKADCSLISADYSQIELRILAHMTNDEGLIKAFQEDLDIHSATAAEVFSVKLEDVTSDLRRAAKAVNFGIAYGQGAYGLAETLGITRTESKEIIDKYFKRFKGVRQYMDETVEQAKSRGYVETLFGRRRYMDELKSNNPAMRSFGERAAINAPVQGSASDIMKLAMIDLYMNVSIPALLQVHDEIIFECPDQQLEDQSQLIASIMENVVQLNVPLKVNVSWGKSWDDAH